ncbi:MAG: MASE1 domain-containing protein [Alphaproteobacteria bacterium]|nr:MASE1 domain-containing protein [Alphaproteobacteria bacterium]
MLASRPNRRDAAKRVPELLWGLASIGIIVLLGRISDVGGFAGLPIKPWKPSAGFVLGILIAFGPRLLPWVIVGSALSFAVGAFATGAAIDWPAPILAGIGGGVGYAVAAWYVRLDPAFDPRLPRSSAMLRLIATGAVATPLVAIAEVSAFSAFGPVDTAEIPVAFLRHCVGNMIGVMVFAPLVLRLVNKAHEPDSVRRTRTAVEIAVIAAVILALTWVIFGVESTDEFKLFDLLFLPVMALAARLGVDGAIAGLTMVQVSMMGWLRLRDYPAPAIVELQTLMLILSAAGLVVGIVVSERTAAHEALRRNEARLRDQELQLARNARLNTVGQMASVLAHELNQPLTGVRAYLRAAARSLTTPGNSGAARDLELATRQVDLAAAIIRRLREFLRRDKPHRETTSAASLVSESVELLQADAKRRHIKLLTDVPADLPSLYVDGIQIKQVLVNLLRNAMEAIPDASSHGIVSTAARLAPDGMAVEFCIRDSGTGIPEEVRGRLFTAFATTKPKGLGLGLATSLTIVESHGGRLWLGSTSIEGTEFRLLLPTTAIL